MPSPITLPRPRCAGIILAAGLALAALPAAAQASAVNLGTAAPFVVLGGSAVTNTGPSVLNGDLGVAPGTSLTGFGSPAVINGTTHANDAVAGNGQGDLTTAYGVAAAQPVTAELTGQDLGGLTLTAGAYRYASTAQLTGQVTLDAQGDPSAQFVFEIDKTLTTASASSVRLINGASPCNVYWQVGSSATLGTTTAFAGTIMALADITLNHKATVQGRALARTGAVTLDDNVLDITACTTPPATLGPAATATPGPAATAPEGTPATTTTRPRRRPRPTPRRPRKPHRAPPSARGGAGPSCARAAGVSTTRAATGPRSAVARSPASSSGSTDGGSAAAPARASASTSGAPAA